MHSLHCISSFKGYRIQPRFILFLICFTLVFTSTDKTFHNFLELQLTLSKKKNFFQEFCFNGFTQTPNPSLPSSP